MRIRVVKTLRVDSLAEAQSQVKLFSEWIRSISLDKEAFSFTLLPEGAAHEKFTCASVALNTLSPGNGRKILNQVILPNNAANNDEVASLRA